MLYDYRCSECNTVTERANSVANRHTNAPECCGQKMGIAIFLSAPIGFVDNMEEYVCPVTMQGVTSRKQRNEIMAREGLISANDFYKPKSFRDKQEKKTADLKKQMDERPPELVEQVNAWARKQVEA